MRNFIYSPFKPLLSLKIEVGFKNLNYFLNLPLAVWGVLLQTVTPVKGTRHLAMQIIS